MADTKISALAAATTLVGAAIPVAQAGVTKQAPASLFGRAGNILVVTASGTTAVPAGTTAVIVNLASPGNVTLTLPTSTAQGGVGLTVINWAGNATITITPNAADTGGLQGSATATMDADGAGIGSNKLTINPYPALLGWFGQ